MSNITTLFKGKFVSVDLVDETIELTVEDNVYSRSESYDLLRELQHAWMEVEMHSPPTDCAALHHDK